MYRYHSKVIHKLIFNHLLVINYYKLNHSTIATHKFQNLNKNNTVRMVIIYES